MTLKNSDGKKIRIQLDKLSEADALWAVMSWDFKDSEQPAAGDSAFSDDSVIKRLNHAKKMAADKISLAIKNVGISPPACYFPVVVKGLNINSVRRLLGTPDSESVHTDDLTGQSISCHWINGNRSLYVSTSGLRIDFVTLRGFTPEEINVCKDIYELHLALDILSKKIEKRGEVVQIYQEIGFDKPRDWGAGTRSINGKLCGCKNGAVEIASKDENGQDVTVSRPVKQLTQTDMVLIKIYADYHEIPLKETETE